MSQPVHPRPRGEHLKMMRLWRILIGSSPPARGTLLTQVSVIVRSRFIPARAGNTHHASRADAAFSVHPRPRGEHKRRGGSENSMVGSSPPARGTLVEFLFCQEWIRFIPARAGNTCGQRRRSLWSPVHPRPRGEHAGNHSPCFVSAGSSPPARGTHGMVTVTQRRKRFIPARAGNTKRTTPRSTAITVHPRPRGEHS